MADAALGSDTAGLDPRPRGLLRRRRLQADASTWCPWTAASRLPRASTTSGRWPGSVVECAAMMAALAPEMDPVPRSARATSRLASPGRPRPTRWFVPGSRRLPRSSAPPRDLSPGDAAGRRRRGMRETAETHASLFAEHRELYGETWRSSSSAVWRSPMPSTRRAFALASATGSDFAELMRGVDVLLTPTLPIVAPPVGIGDLALRGPPDPVHLPVQRHRRPRAGGSMRARRGRSPGIRADRGPPGGGRAGARRRSVARARRLAYRRCSDPTNGEAKEHERHRTHTS